MANVDMTDIDRSGTAPRAAREPTSPPIPPCAAPTSPSGGSQMRRSPSPGRSRSRRTGAPPAASGGSPWRRAASVTR